MLRWTMASQAKPDLSGELAQLVERCDRTAEATGSSPVFSIQQIDYSNSNSNIRVGNTSQS